MTGVQAKVRVALVEDHVLFAEALEIALSIKGYDVHRIHIRDHGDATGDLLVRVLRARPRAVLLDLDLGGALDGGALIKPLVRAGVAVIVVTANLDKARWGECLQAGARCVLPKGTPLATIFEVIRLVVDGRAVISPEERDALIAHHQQELTALRDVREKLDLLTAREREVLGELMRGRPVRVIADSSIVSEATVRTQVKAILAKLEVSSQLAAVGLAHRAGWHVTAESS